ncbi:hypothetical protein ACOMHN_062883 [Nucella lapillus]
MNCALRIKRHTFRNDDDYNSYTSLTVNAAQALQTPVGLYPLARTSITYDVITQTLQPSALARTCPLLATPSEHLDAAFFYDGSPISIATFSLNPSQSSGPAEHFSFAFWVQPDSLNGAIFEYRNNATENSTIRYVKGELVEGAVRMSFGDVNGEMAFLTSTKTLSTGAWKLVTVTASHSLHKMTILIGTDESEESLTVPVRFPLPLLGETNGEDLPVNSHCVPNCSAINPDEYQPPLHLWPLTGRSLSYDVTTLTPSQHPGNSSTCPDLDENGVFNSMSSWRLDGSRSQTLELRVSAEVYSFSIAMYIWTYTSHAVLLEYFSDSASSDNHIAKIVARLQDGRLKVEFRNKTNSTLCSVVSDDVYPLESWKWMSIEWNYGLGKLTLSVDGHITPREMPDLRRRQLATPGVLKVGGTDSPHWTTIWPQPFLGRVTCLAFYGQTLKNEKSQYKGSCEPGTWPRMPSVPTCPGLQTGQYYRPIHLWPLTNDTLAYDIIGNQDAITPSLTTSRNCPVFRPGVFPYPAMAFGNNSADVILRIPSATSYFSFTIGMFLRAEAFQGVLVEYVMDGDVSSGNVSGDVIKHVTMELLPDKTLQVNMTGRHGTPITQLTTEHHIDDIFTLVRLAWDLAHGVQVSIRDHLDVSIQGQFLRLPLGTPGRLRVAGRRVDGGGGGEGRYRGLISCVAFFSRVIDKDHRKELEDECSTVVLPVPPKFNTTVCTNGPATPVYFWPLTNVTMATEVLSGMPSFSLSSCLRLEESGSTLIGPHRRQLYLDGSLHSRLELGVNASLFGGNFTLILLIKPETPGEGQILEYTTATPTTPTPTTTTTTTTTTSISRIQVSYGASSVLEVSVWSVNGSSADAVPIVCSHTLLPGVLHDAWSVLRISTSLAGVMQISINDTVHTGGVCTSHQPLPTTYQGRLSLGGRSAYGSSGYRGALGCLMLFSESMDTSENSQLLEQCQQYDASFNNTGNGTCNQETPMRNGGFQLVQINVQPSAILHPPIRSLVTFTKVACAKECMQTDLCRSFVIKASMTSDHNCWMYDFVTKIALVESTGSKYYEIKQ